LRTEGQSVNETCREKGGKEGAKMAETMDHIFVGRNGEKKGSKRKKKNVLNLREIGRPLAWKGKKRKRTRTAKKRKHHKKRWCRNMSKGG